MPESPDDWQAPEVTPLTDPDGASQHPHARIRNLQSPSPPP